MNIMHWNPLLDRVLDHAAHGLPTRHWQPPVDIRETDDAYQVDMELPAVAPEDVRIAVKDGVLRVAGERRNAAANDEDAARVYLRERRYGKFARSFRLPRDADAEAIRATAKNGVLAIVIGKSATARERAIEVQAA